MIITNIEQFALDHIYAPIEEELNSLRALPDPIEQVVGLLKEYPIWADFVISRLLLLGGFEIPLWLEHEIFDFIAQHRYVAVKLEANLLCIRKKDGAILDNYFAPPESAENYSFNPEMSQHYQAGFQVDNKTYSDCLSPSGGQTEVE